MNVVDQREVDRRVVLHEVAEERRLAGEHDRRGQHREQPRARGHRPAVEAQPRSRRHAQRQAGHRQHEDGGGGQLRRRSRRVASSRARRSPAPSPTDGSSVPGIRSAGGALEQQPAAQAHREQRAPGTPARRRSRLTAARARGAQRRGGAGRGCESRNDEKKIWMPTIISVAASTARRSSRELAEAAVDPGARRSTAPITTPASADDARRAQAVLEPEARAHAVEPRVAARP